MSAPPKPKLNLVRKSQPLITMVSAEKPQLTPAVAPLSTITIIPNIATPSTVVSIPAPLSSTNVDRPQLGLYLTDHNLSPQITELIQNNAFFLFVELLKRVSQDYEIPLEDLHTKYLTYFKTGLKNSTIFSQLSL